MSEIKREIILDDEQEMDFDLEDMMSSAVSEDAMENMFEIVSEASSQQMAIALQLTELITEKDPKAGSDKKNILKTFQEASQAVAECHPLHDICERFVDFE